MKIGDKLICDNGHTYTIGEGDKHFNLGIYDKEGEQVNAYHDYSLERCMPNYKEEQLPLRVGFESKDFTFVKELIEV